MKKKEERKKKLQRKKEKIFFLLWTSLVRKVYNYIFNYRILPQKKPIRYAYIEMISYALKAMNEIK